MPGWTKQLIGTLSSSGALRMMDQLTPGGRLVRVLAYHRVDEPDRTPYLDPHLITATPDVFEEQMKLLAARYTPITPAHWLAALDGGPPLPRDAVLVTFDDGYRDFQEYAYPIAREHGIPLTLFVATDFVDDPGRSFWWDALHCALTGTMQDVIEADRLGTLRIDTPEEQRAAMDRLRPYIESLPFDESEALIDSIVGQCGIPPHLEPVLLTWEELATLHGQGGLTIGAHSKRHPLLSRVPPEVAREEITESHARVKERIGESLPIFCYPNGSPEAFNQEVMDILAEEGFRMAYTMIGDLWPPRDGDPDPLAVPRIPVYVEMTAAQLDWRLSRARRALGLAM